MRNYRLLEWDTHFFGYKIASIEADRLKSFDLNEIIKELKEMNFSLAYCFVHPEDNSFNESLRQNSALLVDVKVTYSILTDSKDNLTISDNIKPYRFKYVSDKLKSLALQSGKYSRFNIDPNFRENEYEKLYFEWIYKSVTKTLANEILVYQDGNEIQGFITLRKIHDIGSIGLIAVDEKMRGKSIGRKLLNAAIVYFKENSIKHIEVITQKENSSACSFYESYGFEVSSVINVYHLWIR